MLRAAEVIDESAQGWEGRVDGGPVSRGQRVKGGADSPLVGVIPIEQLAVPGGGEGDHCDPPIAGARAAVDESGVDELLNEAADRVRGKPELVREFADSAGLVVLQGHQQFDLRHRQGFPGVVGADAGPQGPPQARDHLRQHAGRSPIATRLLAAAHFDDVNQVFI